VFEEGLDQLFVGAPLLAAEVLLDAWTRSKQPGELLTRLLGRVWDREDGFPPHPVLRGPHLAARSAVTGLHWA